jgi:hypothetical protein
MAENDREETALSERVMRDRMLQKKTKVAGRQRRQYPKRGTCTD